MSDPTGVACKCDHCTKPQWYDEGVCQGCQSEQGIRFTWIAQTKTGGDPAPAPSARLELESGVGAQLVEVWANLLMVRGLSPYLTSVGQAIVNYRSALWYRQRGVDVTVQFSVPTDPGFADRLNRASSWTNKALLVRVVTTFEAFACQSNLKEVQLPNNLGMREFHHARRLRNKIAHGDLLTDQKLVKEAEYLFGANTVVNNSCNLDIDLVLEPLWARLLLYARSLEIGSSVPARPGVVVAVDEACFIAQTFDGVLIVQQSGTQLSIGDIVSL